MITPSQAYSDKARQQTNPLTTERPVPPTRQDWFPSHRSTVKPFLTPVGPPLEDGPFASPAVGGQAITAYIRIAKL